MGEFQYTKLYRRFEIDMSFTPASGATGAVNWEFRTERPGTIGMTDRHVGQITLASGETNRRPHRVNLPGAVRGRMYQIHLAPPTSGQPNTGQLSIFSVKVYAKILHPHQNTTYDWYAVPMIGTSDVWSEVPLVMVPTSDNWQDVPVPMRSTSKDWSQQAVPIAPTNDGWSQRAWPFRQTPKEPVWAQLPVDE